jgi:hypothetical protein
MAQNLQTVNKMKQILILDKKQKKESTNQTPKGAQKTANWEDFKTRRAEVLNKFLALKKKQLRAKAVLKVMVANRAIRNLQREISDKLDN